MKARKLVALVVAGIVVAAAACAGGGPAPTATPTARPQPTPTATAGPVGGATAAGEFHGVPVPTGVAQAQAATWQVPAGQASGGYANVEWRTFRTSMSQEQLKSFYKSEVTKRGWTQTIWMEGTGQQGEMAWGVFSKGNQDELAWVYVVPDQAEFDLVLMWAGGKKQ